ncbi:23S rRNA pseudouridine(2604) synthase RluF [Wohlfahrtiimonas populi]|uniref:23S rRNA pseudouridine(2604) synthase RluF n=1 Tax=Wohlfahrtiimonas populi TaxID=1940240 RepID=UPI00098D3E16|nr:23S rRNA pseudouridine(2604) synthase RluF [Wohlfahrtiimonas populi]
MRLNKFISESGKTSRRGADKLIEEGRVKINGKKAKIGDQVNPGDKVLVDGALIEEIASPQSFVYIALNKPVGITSTTEKNVKSNIVDFMNYPTRIFHIGRLDKDSEGLILMTDDGDIVNEILRSENKHEKEYIVSVDRPINDEFVQKMSAGVKILGTKTLPCKVTQLSSNEFNIILMQGLNRQIRRMCETLGYNVTSLKRLRIMNIELGKLPVGEWRYLTGKEQDELFEDLGYGVQTTKWTP